mgnify:FL=1
MHPNGLFVCLIQQEIRVKTLIALVVIMLAAASFSFAQSSEGPDSMLLARADTETRTVRNIITKKKGPGDAFKNEFAHGVNTGRTYESDTLNVEDLPLVMSSADKKTVSIVLPPFLYFKTKF